MLCITIPQWAMILNSAIQQNQNVCFKARHGISPKNKFFDGTRQATGEWETGGKEFVLCKNDTLCILTFLKNLAHCEPNPIPSISFHAC